MKRYFLLSLFSAALLVLPALSFVQAAGGGGGGGIVCALPTCQVVTLSSGWNLVSTPKVLTSHAFSATETSANFDIYALDPSKTSGWATLADLGQSEFTPLWSYFINNKTGVDQILSLSYKVETTPSERLFSRTFSTAGWYSIGVANATYALPVGTSAAVDTNNPSNILNGLSSFYSSIVDLTHGWFSVSPDKIAVSGTWGSATPTDVNTLHDFRETKGYAIYINTIGGLYAGFQNSATSTPAPVVDPNSITIAAAVQPANSLAPSGASRIPFTIFTLTNNNPSTPVTVNGITIQRTGPSVDANLSGVALVDSNGLQVGATKTLDSNHQAIIGDSFILGAGQSATFTVVGSIPGNNVNASGQLITLQVVAVSSSAAIAGSLPIVGATHTINTTLSLGSVATSTSTFDPGANQSKIIGDTAVKFSGIKFTTGSAENLKLYALRWKQYGTILAADISNVVVNVGGTNYPITLDSTGKYYTSVFPGGITIPSGGSVDAYVQGDLSGSNATGHTVSFGIESGTDLYFVGQTYGYGITLPTLGSPWFKGYTTTVNPGVFATIANAASVPAQNVAVNIPNQPLGGFTTTISGENIQVHSMAFFAATSSVGIGLLTNITLVDENGVVVAGPVDAAYNAASGKQKILLSDLVTFPTGTHTYTVKGKLPASFSAGTITLSTNPSVDWTNITGQTSGAALTISQAQFVMNTMTVKTGALAITMSSTPVAQNITAGVSAFAFANIQLDASVSGEDMRLASLPISFVGAAADLSGCQLWDVSTALNTGSRVVNALTSGAANTFTLDNTLTIVKGTVKTLALKCNVSGAAVNGNTYQFGVNNSYSYSATGVSSGSAIVPTVTTGNGSTMTVATGMFTLAVDASSPSYSVAAGGTTGQTLGVIKLRATNEDVQLNKLGLTLINGSASSVTQVYIYNGATLVGTAVFTGINTTATSTLNIPITLPKDTDKLLTIKADLSLIGPGQPGTEGQLVKIDPFNAEGSGVSSGNTIKIGATGGTAGIRTFRSYPTLSADTLSASGAIGNTPLMRFKVTANSAGSVGIGQLKFTVATSSNVSVTNTNLYVYADSSYSSPISGQGVSGLIGAGNVAPSAGGSVTQTPSTNPITVSAGTTYYFELRGTLAASSATYSIVTTLKGDTSFDGMNTVAGVAGNFVWSPNLNGVSTFGTSDWANGFGLPGLSSTGIVQSRSN